MLPARAGLRIPDQAGGGENDEAPQPRAAARSATTASARASLREGDVEQQARRRKLDAARPRRHHAQQPPQHRQADEADQEQRFGEGERQSHHAAGPTLIVVVRVPDLLTCMPACRNSIELGGGAVGRMGREQPVESAGLGADLVAVQREPRGVVLRPALGAARRDHAEALGLDELDAAGIRERLFGGIDHLHHRAMRAGAGQARERGFDLRDRRPEIRQHDDLGERGRHEGRRQAQPVGIVMRASPAPSCR